MRVLYLLNALTHYYNLVLSRLNDIPDIEIMVAAPKSGAHVGEAVYQTKEGINFKVYELEEYTRFVIYSSFRGLDRLLAETKPDIVIVGDAHLLTFLFNIPVVRARKNLGIKLIYSTIPFRIPTFEQARKLIHSRTIAFQKLPPWMGSLLHWSGIESLIRLAHVYLMKHVYNLPDAHLDYVEDAYDIFGSYGVDKEKIFITYNSPDTDKLFEIRDAITTDGNSLLTENGHRLIHVGRLVEWKRVDLLIRAFARVRKEYKNAELIVIGFGPQEQFLKKLANDLHIDAYVKFVGGVYDPKTLGRYLMSSSVYVLAGMGGLSINDAMAFGLPVICSVCDGTEKKLVHDEYNGKYFKEGDEDDLVAKILYLFEHPQLMRQMGLNSTSIIKKEINIHTVLKGFVDAFAYVMKKNLL